MSGAHSIEAMCQAGCTTARAIRYWEELDILGPVARSGGDTRRYTDEQIDRAKIIAAAKFGGWNLDEIKEMLVEYGPEVYDALLVRLSDQMRAAARLVENLPLPKVSMEFDL